MTQVQKKIRRISPLIKAKKAALDHEASILASIREQKRSVVKEMREYQQRYMQGIETLNRERTSSDRSMLSTLEKSLNHVKTKWHKLFVAIQEIESQERAQIAQLESALKALESFEKLKGNYEKQFKHEQNKLEQQHLDEAALRGFMNSRD